MQKMVGTWSVQQQMWPGDSAKAVAMPPAVARRRLVNGAFLEEVMELDPRAPTQDSSKAMFTRTSYFNFNATNRQYEYFSLDSRLPQMMNERSRDISSRSVSGEAKNPDNAAIVLYGGSFIAPEWGKAKNVAFRYRLTVGAVEKESGKDRQVVRLYLTPQADKNAREFRAFEYTYTRKL